MKEHIEFDRANFPMVWVESLEAYIHLLPVTKIQFEYFLWDSKQANLDQAWLDRIYTMNERITPKRVNKGNYWRAFFTGIAPSEAELFAAWCADSDEDTEYRLPSSEEWRKAYKEMQNQPAIPLDDPRLGRLAERTKTLLKQLVGSLPETPETLAEQMLFDGGVLEWVNGEGSYPTDYVGHGQTNRSWDYSGQVLSRPYQPRTIPKGPTDMEGRASYFGFRLLRCSNT